MPANRPNRTAIEKKAIETYGEESQIVMCMEECAELIQACTKLYRSYGGPDHQKAAENCREEVADVQIMLDQMRMIFGPTDIEEDAKLTRLAKRLGMLEDDNGETR